MLSALWTKCKESALSVIPVALIVLIINLTPFTNFTGKELGVFCACALVLIIGMALFNLGADMAMTPMGEQVGSGLPKAGKFKLLIAVCFIMGVFITIAEPDLSVLASQVKDVIDGTALTVTIGVGVGLFLVLAVLRIVFRLHLGYLMTFFYMLLFALTALVLERGGRSFLPLAFDSGGVTTGPITVPFIMALGLGVSTAIADKHDRESSFGYIALCSIGPILAVMALGLTATGEVQYSLPDYSIENKLGGALFTTVLHTGKEVLFALVPIIIFFFILQTTILKLPKKRIMQIVVGIFYTFFGLLLFLSAVAIGFMPIGYKMGTCLAENKVALTIFSFILGMTVVLAEPAIHVLNKGYYVGTLIVA
jgi:MFS family permease